MQPDHTFAPLVDTGVEKQASVFQGNASIRIGDELVNARASLARVVCALK
jgi:hypothetical protein